LSATTASRLREDQRELAELLGAEKAQRLGDHRDNLMERNSVAGFRSELPEALQLSDAQAEKLANALGDERRRVTREWEQRGAGIAMTAFPAGLVYYPNKTQGVEDRVAEASEFQRRQRERAGEILTAAQLDAFTEQQKDALDFARSGWESEQQARASGAP